MGVSRAHISDSFFRNNYGVRGGVFYFTGFTKAYVDNCVFIGNEVSNQAGAITHESYAIVRVKK